MHSLPVRDWAVGAQQDNLALLIREPKDQDLGHERPDLARQKIGDCDHLSALQILWRVKRGDLGACLLFTQFWTEIDPELDGRLARLWERFGACHGADPDVDLEEILDPDQISHCAIPLSVPQRP